MSFINLSLSNPIIRSADTTTGTLLTGLGARFVMEGGSAEGRFSLVEHPIGPKGLAAPMHLHTREDEYSFILEGEWGFKLGETVIYGSPGDLVYKPRNVWHTFWNASDRPARLLEIISPAGFEHFFEELAEMVAERRPDVIERLGELSERFGLQVDVESVPALVAEYGVVVTEMAAPAAGRS